MQKIIKTFEKVIMDTIPKNIIFQIRQKYSLKIIITEILYVFKSGVSWRDYRCKINNSTLYAHFNCLYKKKTYLRKYMKYY